ncbi:MAG: hypothetical protein HFJ17_00480 [Clostridia bacterium]|nr:hypothetical protein [Clostridia bacterium]
MNIGIDIDDTITDTFDYLIPYIAEYFNVDINYLKDNNISYCNLPNDWKNNEIEFAKKYYDDIIINTPVKPDTAKYINKIREMENKIFIITARDTNLYTDPYKTTTEQLNTYNINYDKLVCTFDKAQVCVNENIDLLIDDSIYNCTEASKVGINVLLFNSKSNYNINTNLNRTNSWKEIYEYLLNKKTLKHSIEFNI